MGRPEKPVSLEDGPTARFAHELRRLREQAGSPTYRDMARCALYSASVLSSAASGHRMPSLHVTLAYVTACGGDTEDWRQRWSRAQLAESRPPADPRRQAGRSTPAPAAPLPRPAQLPPSAGVFTGRGRELRRLTDRGPAGGPVVISGPPGVGKSELALAYARQLAPVTVDGQLYADLGYGTASAAEPQAVVDGFLRALGVLAQELPAAADQRLGLYRTLLAQRRVLVLLENACCERQVRPLLAESGRSITVMVGRAPLLGLSGVHRVRLDVFSRSDSVAYIARLLPQRALDDPAACDQLAALCADLPFALDIATRRLAARPQLSLRSVIGRLQEPRALLDWLSIGDLSVREMLDTGYAQLDDASRTLLGRLVRRDGALAAGRLVSAPPGDEDRYEQLAESGLLRWEQPAGTYRADTLTRAFITDLARSPSSVHRRIPAQSPLEFHTLPRLAAAHRGLSAD
jgi:DNA polymerase III delta prime subunit